MVGKPRPDSAPATPRPRVGVRIACQRGSGSDALIRVPPSRGLSICSWQVRRALGFKLVGEAQLLREFVAFAEASGQRTITTSLALQWARLPPSATPNYLSRRLRAVRGFVRYLKALDPACEVPPPELLPASKYRPARYVYRDEEIVAVMVAARQLRPPLRGATFHTLIGLLACTGRRIGEAIKLDREDFDLTCSRSRNSVLSP